MSERYIDFKSMRGIPPEELNVHAKSRYNKAMGISLNKKTGRLLPFKFKAVRQKENVEFVFKCRCDCGNEVWVRAINIRSGTTTSCGCYNADKQRLPGSDAASNALYTVRKADAKRRFLSFTLTREEYKSLNKQDCYYCGAKPANKYGSGLYNEDFVYQGIDRIDNQIGYEMSNCRPCCKYCNIAKFTYSEQEFIDKIKNILNHMTINGRV